MGNCMNIQPIQVYLLRSKKKIIYSVGSEPFKMDLLIFKARVKK